MRRVAGAALAVAALGATVLAGCFKPNIEDGGFACESVTKACPEGFGCAGDNRCYRDPSAVIVDGGGETMCILPPVTPTCSEDPMGGESCNPACQKGCACGRCNVLASGHANCVPSGTVKLGEVCKLGSADNCLPGLICLQEKCGNSLGRCYKHCTSSDQCDNTICTITIQDSHSQDTPFKTCDVPPRACDPVNNTGCPDPALNCYLTIPDSTLCDCQNAAPGGKNGDPCILYSDCAPGYVCAGTTTGNRCRFACSIATPACPTGQSCQHGTKYGYCE